MIGKALKLAWLNKRNSTADLNTPIDTCTSFCGNINDAFLFIRFLKLLWKSSSCEIQSIFCLFQKRHLSGLIKTCLILRFSLDSRIWREREREKSKCREVGWAVGTFKMWRAEITVTGGRHRISCDCRETKKNDVSKTGGESKCWGQQNLSRRNY
jgi:hypothetical protein